MEHERDDEAAQPVTALASAGARRFETSEKPVVLCRDSRQAEGVWWEVLQASFAARTYLGSPAEPSVVGF